MSTEKEQKFIVWGEKIPIESLGERPPLGLTQKTIIKEFNDRLKKAIENKIRKHSCWDHLSYRPPYRTCKVCNRKFNRDYTELSQEET